MRSRLTLDALAVALLPAAAFGWNLPVTSSAPPTSTSSPRAAPPIARVKNSDGQEDREFVPRTLKTRKPLNTAVSYGDAAAAPPPSTADSPPPSAAPEKPLINYENPDLQNTQETFAALCRLYGVADERDAEMDFDGFVLAFEQLFNQGVPLEPEVADELKAKTNCDGDDDDVSMASWAAFHRSWTQESSMAAHLGGIVTRRREAAKQAEKRAAEMKQAEDVVQKLQTDHAEALMKAKEAARAEQQSRPTLMADEAKKKKAKQGKWFEEREAAAELAAQYRSLDPEKWQAVIDDVGGLDRALEEIRRRIWVPLCAPMSLLDELGAERVKGLLLYGPPGCGKSYLAARLAAGLSRRPPTLVSGPEIMDKYVGSSEQTLRTIFTSPPAVEAQLGDAQDIVGVMEANELHVIVLDEFDAIARKRGDGSGGNSEGTAARDSVVNQLLALMDGVSGLPVPTFIIALTNRRELVDNAILRPGRLEVHVPVDKPDATGRAAILRIHAERMRESGRLALDDGAMHAADECTLERVDDAQYGSWIDEMAEKTAGFSGAAMAATVRAAVARALDRAVSSENLACRVSSGDFDAAIADLRNSQLELELMDTSELGGLVSAKDEAQATEPNPEAAPAA